MEQKRTLWIVAAAGVFLLVVVGAALLLSFQTKDPVQTYYTPADGFISSAKAPDTVFEPGVPPSQRPASPDGNADNGVAPVFEQDSNTSRISDAGQADATIDTSGTEGSYPENTPAAMTAGNVTVFTDNTLVYGTGSTTTIDLNTLKSSPASASSVTPQNNYTASQMKEASAPQSPSYTASENYYAPAPGASRPAVKKETAPAETVKSPAKTTVAKKSTAVSAKSAAAEKPSSYWIQVGSYEAKKFADNARSALEENKIPNEVFTYKDSKGKLFYRVRVGPYTTKSEAEYWQKRIAATDDFANTSSYIVKN